MPGGLRLSTFSVLVGASHARESDSNRGDYVDSACVIRGQPERRPASSYKRLRLPQDSATPMARQSYRAESIETVAIDHCRIGI
ncbi:hypothetical protein GCM10009304_37900 [Pseudomonas matsuisoli]|uniref:Uncharacterized protein n=1 Tax=Pseudomonas matsuisoli TaxID=1515666 RepID=A0A917V1D2_9PSED|nr:hypothetical protein GCM10009304_37900 [Pseudomonas matsuisoli]